MGALPEGLDAVVGFGSNLGDSRAIFRRARTLLAQQLEILESSSIYLSRPMGGPKQPDYLNAALRVRAKCAPLELLAILLQVESTLGRVRRERWGPRSIDLDLLWVRGAVEDLRQLQVPHPRLRERPFALVPLLDVAPHAVDPKDGFGYRHILESLAAPGVTMLARQW